MRRFIHRDEPRPGTGFYHVLKGLCLSASLMALLFCLTGCESSSGNFAALPGDKTNAEQSAAITLREGDTIAINFPGAPNLNTVEQIRRDGKIKLALVGEVSAVGRTPAQLEKELIKLYADQIVSKTITVSVQSSSFVFFVTGAVLRPGRCTSDRPISALEAVMEAGGFDYAKANLKAVKVYRNENGRTEQHIIDLNAVMKGVAQPFMLKPSDILFVPEKFQWF